jgi:tripartite-type tricarboxylate transporter receptor subunit TctC
MTESWPDAPDFMKRASVYILTVPAKTPREVVNRINADLTRTVADPVIKERIERLGMLPRPPMDVDQVAAHLRQTTEDWKRVVQNSNIREALKATTN